MTERFLIWSFMHDGWWVGSRYGYTDDHNLAGRFSYTDAVEICQQGCRGKRLGDAMVPESAVEGLLVPTRIRGEALR